MPDTPAACSKRDLRDFRFRLRHDHILKMRLRHLKQLATISLARELGFQITLDELKVMKPNSKS